MFDVLQFTSDEDGSSSDLDRMNTMIDKMLAQDDRVDDMAEDAGLDINDLTYQDDTAEEELGISLF